MFRHFRKIALAFAAVAAMALAAPQTATVASAGEGWANAQGRTGFSGSRYKDYHKYRSYRNYGRRYHHRRYYGHYPRYRNYGYNPYYYGRHRSSSGAAIAAGIAGVVIGSAIANSGGYHSGGWVGSQAWINHCRRKYKTFDARTGTFMHVSGVRKRCR